MNNDSINRYFFVDYENVNHDGLNGITRLTESDSVRIYYSENAKTITFGLHKRIQESSADFEYIKVDIPIKNAIDCKILFDIQSIFSNNINAECLIVSKDGDYDKTIAKFNTCGYNVKKVMEICKIEQSKKCDINVTKQDEKKREAQVRSFFGRHFKESIYVEKKEEIISCILDSKTKLQINNKFMKYYPSEIVSEIYGRIQPLIKDMPGR